MCAKPTVTGQISESFPVPNFIDLWRLNVDIVAKLSVMS